MTKNSVCHALYFKNHISYDLHSWYTCVKEYYLQTVCSFFKKLIFEVIRGVKGQKMAQNDKKFCLSRSVPQEPYIRWLWSLVHMCKMMTSPGAFHLFKILIFQVIREYKGKKWPKWQKILSIALHISGTIHLMIVIYGAYV